MRRIAYVLLALIWVAGIWIWFHRTPDAPLPKPVEPGVPAVEPAPAVVAKLDAPAPPRRPPTARHRQQVRGASLDEPVTVLHVRSSVGLPLIEVEGSVPGGEWERAGVLGDTLELEPGFSSFLLRAAGHLPLEVRHEMREVVLEPDALLTLEAPHIRSWAQDVRTLRDPDWVIGGAEWSRADAARRSGALAEFPDADHLLFAFSPSVIASEFPGDADLSFARADGSQVRLRVHATSGLRATWRVPPADLANCAPLDVRIEGTSPDSSWTHLRLQRLDPASSAPQREDYAWGSVEIARGEAPSFADPLHGRPKDAHLDAVALGARFLLCGQDADEHYGSIDFVHDGTARTLVLQAPVVLRGMAVDALDSKPILQTQVRVGPEDSSEAREWIAEDIDFGGEDGRFEIRLPQDWARARSAAVEAPEKLVLELCAAGHRSRRVAIERNGRREIDVGALVLERNGNPIVIADGGNQPQLAVEAEGLSFADRPEEQWGVAHAFYVPDDQREIELAIADGADLAEPLVRCRDLVLGEATARAFTRKLGEKLLITLDGEALALSLGPEGKYHMLPRSARRVSVECAELPKDGGTWTLGWRGGGTWAGFRRVSAKGAVTDAVVLPEMATELWWSAGEAPPELCKRPGSTLVLTQGAQSLVLR